jgi:hypothetical protein
MSEPLFSNSGTMTAPPPAAPGVPPELDGPTGRDRKPVLALAAVGAALIVGAGAFFFLTGSGSGEEESAAPVGPVPTAAAPSGQATPAPTAKPAASAKPAKASSTSRDPFAPLFPSTAADPAPSSAATAPAGTGATPAPSSSTGGTPSVTLSVSEVDPEAQTATVTVNGKKYAATLGKSFGEYYMLYSVFNAKCAGILVGDQSTVVCAGNPVTTTP